MTVNSTCVHGKECMRTECDGTRHFHLDFERMPTVLVHEWVRAGNCRIVSSMGCTLGELAG